MEFRAFSSIVKMMSPCQITEKVHGTNAAVIVEFTIDGVPIVRAQSRTRLLLPEDDNYGFAAWVKKNEAELARCLGPGLHFGEWYGSGVNSGYNLVKGDKRLALFNQKFRGKELPPGVEVVPVLYEGPYREGVVAECLAKLKAEGSVIQPGFMRPEGVVIRFERNGALFKEVLDPEETPWKQGDKLKEASKKEPVPSGPEVLALMQPIRLEKLLSRDESYLRGLPGTLPQIVKDYVLDMEKENQYDGVEEGVVKAAKGRYFAWVKTVLKEMGYSL